MNTEKAQILLVEDEEQLGFVVTDNLTALGHDVTWVKDGNAGWDAYKANPNFDVLLFDVMLPKMDGFTLGKKVRESNELIPMIFLTAKSLQEDVNEGLKLGADDYITKPFDIEELQLRIQLNIKRTKHLKSEIKQEFELGNLIFNYRQLTLTENGELIKRLTKKEAELLRVLCEHKDQIIPREKVLIEIWGSDDYFMGRSMDVFITRLRKYLKSDPRISINNVHGVGFKLEVAS